jgi:predicted permease
MWPAWRASRTAPAKDLKLRATGSGSHRLGRWIIPAQVALGLVLLNAALLMANTLMAYMRQNSGFNAGDAVLGEMDLSDSGVAAKDVAARNLEYLRQVQAAPGVQAAALMTMIPISGSFGINDMFAYDAKGNLHVNKQIWPEDVAGDYFTVLGTRILQGRAFTAADASGDRNCILSAAAAAEFFAGGSALGRRVYFGNGKDKPKEHSGCQVVGVAEDARFASLLEPAPEMVYMPLEQIQGLNYFTIAVKTANSNLGADTLRNIYRREFPAAPLPRIERFSDAIDYDLSRQRLLSSVSGGFALLALTLVATGLYGILGRTVTERRREIGIRMALGAKRKQIVIALAKSAAMRVGVGVVAGVLLAAAGGKLMRSLLYGVTPGNPWVAFATLALLVAVLALAFVYPAGRAASVNPMEAIREE